MGQYESHPRKLRDAPTWLAHHLDRVAHLGPHLGPNLLQVSPRWRRNVARLGGWLDDGTDVVERDIVSGDEPARADGGVGIQSALSPCPGANRDFCVCTFLGVVRVAATS